MKEHDAQRVIVDALRLAGCVVLETTAYRQRGPSGTHRGVPDLLCWIDGTARPLAIEVKRPDRRVRFSSVEQRQMYEAGRIVLVSTPEQALTQVLAHAPHGSALSDAAVRVLAGLISSEPLKTGVPSEVQR